MLKILVNLPNVLREHIFGLYNIFLTSSLGREVKTGSSFIVVRVGEQAHGVEIDGFRIVHDHLLVTGNGGILTIILLSVCIQITTLVLLITSEHVTDEGQSSGGLIEQDLLLIRGHVANLVLLVLREDLAALGRVRIALGKEVATEYGGCLVIFTLVLRVNVTRNFFQSQSLNTLSIIISHHLI